MTSFTRALPIASMAMCVLSSTPLEAGETRSGVNVSAAAGVSSNPYLTETDPTTTGVLDISIGPWARIETARTTFDLAAYANGRVFASRYDFENAEGASVSFRSKRSARTSIYGSAKIDTTSARSWFSRSAAAPGVTDPVNPIDPDAPATEGGVFVPGDDVTLLGLAGRSTSLSSAVGLDHQLSGRSAVGVNAGYQHLGVSSTAVSGYDSFSAGAAYTNQVSEHTRAGARFEGRRTSYEAGGHSTIFVARATMERRIDASWTLAAEAGVSTARLSAAGGMPSTRATSLSGLVALCNERPARNFCVSLERSQLPGALGRTRRVDNAAVTFGERLSARERLDVGMRYGRSRSMSGDPANDPSVTIANVDTTYTRVLSERAEAYGFASVARSYSPSLATDVSVNAGVGIRLRVGRTR